MKKRIITGIVMGLIFIPFFGLGNIFSNLICALLAYIGCFELIRMHQKQSQIAPICKFIIPIFASMIVLAINYAMIIDVVYLLIVEFVFLIILPLFNKNICFKDILMFIFAIIYTGISFGIISFIRNINLENFELTSKLYHVEGLILFVYLFVITISTDVFAYFFGMKFGKHKLCPSISPKKSIEGSIAGTVFASVFGTLVLVVFRNYFINNQILYFIMVFLISLVLSITSQLGDLVASKIKREYEIKDYGKIFPGHGGVLDRFDSVIYTSLMFYIILQILGVL